ncbi:MAG TPA: ABC transporter substrate-binding protein [Chloroflexi bacterium]|nr:ABC transporter substrate-binding protein [Chloroflexota bacterium]
MTQYLRWQALIALSGILLFSSVLVSLSQSLTTTFVPERGGTYIEGVIDQPGNLNPLFLESRTDEDIGALVFRGLTRATADGRIQPDLATRWEISPDSLSYTFHLRDDVFWHDGEPFSAADAIYTIGVLQDPTYAGNLALAEVWRTVRVEVLDPLTVRVTLPEPYAPFLSFTTFGILPSHLLGDYSASELPGLPFSRHPIGTGRWRLADENADSITLQAFPDFYGPPPLLDRLTLRFYPDATALFEGYRRGEIMGLGRVRPQDVNRVVQEPTLTLWSAPLDGFTGIVLNLAHPLFADPAVRQALLYGLNRPALIAQILSGQGLVANSFIVPTNWAYNPGIKQYPFNPARARQLLEQAGWVDQNGDGVREKDGLSFAFSLVTNEEDPQRVRLVEAIARQWAAVGVKVEVKTVSFASLTQDVLRPRNFDAVMITLLDLPTDPDPYPLFHSSQTKGDGRNFAGFVNERADRLMVEGRHVIDEKVRRELYFDVQELFAEQLPILPLYHPVYSYAFDTRVRNVQIGPLNRPSERFWTLPNWFIKTRRVIRAETSSTPAP